MTTFPQLHGNKIHNISVSFTEVDYSVCVCVCVYIYIYIFIYLFIYNQLFQTWGERPFLGASCPALR